MDLFLKFGTEKKQSDSFFNTYTALERILGPAVYSYLSKVKVENLKNKQNNVALLS